MGGYYGRFVGALIQGFSEVGHAEEAGDIAGSFLAHREPWASELSPDDFGIADDVMPLALAAALRAGRISREDFDARRAAWVRGWEAKVGAGFRGHVWLHGYAAAVDTPDDAREALAALPGYEPLPPYRRQTLVDPAVGLTFLLGGRTEEAIAWLTKATRSCFAYYAPVEDTSAHAWLGQALAAKGDKKGACAAYKVVLDRWGKARPRSTTAERAKKQATELGCEGLKGGS
jgi:predicted Zn-dependent protease